MRKGQTDDQSEVTIETEPEPAALVMVEALVPMWADNGVVRPGTRYRLPVETAKYLAGQGFVTVVAEAD